MAASNIKITHESQEADTNEAFRDEQETNQENVENTIQEDEHTNLIKLKTSKKKALLEFRCRMEDAILGNYLFGKSYIRGNAKELEDLRNITLWGVPLLPTKGHPGTDTVLLKFLKARDFKTSEAFELLRKTLIWRREFRVEGIVDEKLCVDLENMVFFDSIDKEGHPLCYNKVYGALKKKGLYKKTLGTEENREQFLRWRVQFMERGIEKGLISFNPGSVDSMVQITDLKNSPGPSCLKELQLVSKKAILLIQENYPELIHRNIIINVPFWYYAYHVLISSIITQRNRSKFVFARPSRVTQTLLKYIPPENIPIQYGGLQRGNDEDFSPSDKASELKIKKGFTKSIKIPVEEDGVTVVWDVTAVGWEVTYKEEFIPDDEGSYRILLQKEKQMGESVRNSFYISEPGKIVITISNGTFKKKKVFYRFKTKPTVPVYILLK